MMDSFSQERIMMGGSSRGRFKRMRFLVTLSVLVGCCLASFYGMQSLSADPSFSDSLLIYVNSSDVRSTEPQAETIVSKSSTATTSFNSNMSNNMTETDQRLQSMLHLMPTLPICRLFPAHCARLAKTTTSKWRYNVLPAAKMMRLELVGGMGAGVLSLVTLVCVALGIYLSSSNSNTSTLGHSEEKNSVHHNERKDDDDDDPTHITPPSSVFKRILDNSMDYWSGNANLTFTYPATTFKLFIAILLLVELNDLNERAALALPEVVELFRAKPDNDPNKHEFITPVADWFMPSLTEETADWWVQRLQTIRGLLLASWLAYLLIPPTGTRFLGAVGGTCYVSGALLYVYMGAIVSTYKPAHKLLGVIDFVAFSIPAVPFLACPKHGPRAARWLRRMLYLGVLVPVYLWAGISKFRYHGVMSNLSGQWIAKMFQIPPEKYWYLWWAAVISWSNAVLELIFPLAVVLWMDDYKITRTLFHGACISFHVSIFFLMTPNFLLTCVLHLLAMDPLSWQVLLPSWRMCVPKQQPQLLTWTNTTKQHHETPNYSSAETTVSWRDWLRLVVSFCVIFGWFRVNFLSDLDHLTGKLSPMKKRDPYIPFSELSMYAAPTGHANYVVGLLLVTLSALAYAYAMFRDKGQRSRYLETLLGRIPFLALTRTSKGWDDRSDDQSNSHCKTRRDTQPMQRVHVRKTLRV